jgi:hypothetical protein
MDDLKGFLLNVLGSLVAAAIWATARPISRWLISLAVAIPASATPISRWLISLAVLRMSSRERDRFREEWPAHLNDIDGAFGKLRHALACVFIAAKIDRELRSRQETQSSRAHSTARGWDRKALSGLATAAMTFLWLNPSLRTFPPSDPVVTQFPTNGTTPLEYSPSPTSSWPSPRVTEYAPPRPPAPSNDDAPIQGPTLALSAPYPRPSDLIRLRDSAINPGIALSISTLPSAADILNGSALSTSVAFPQTFYSSKAITLGDALNQPHTNAIGAFSQTPYSSATTIVADVLSRFTLSANTALAEPFYASMKTFVADLFNNSITNPSGIFDQPSYTPISTSWADLLKVNSNVVLGQLSYASLTTATTDVLNSSIVNLALPSYTPISTSWADLLKVNSNVVLGQPSYASLTTATTDVLNSSIVNLAQPSYTPTTTSWVDVLKVNPNVVLGQPSYASLTTSTTDVLNSSIVNLAQPSYTPITTMCSR